VCVRGFDDDTQEDELIAFFYLMVYGGGLRNVADGKVKRCQFFQDFHKEDMEHLKEGLGGVCTDLSTIAAIDDSLNMSIVSAVEGKSISRYALITFDNRKLAELAIFNEKQMLFKGTLLCVEFAEKSHILNVIKGFATKSIPKAS
jgi:hypothetical protein